MLPLIYVRLVLSQNVDMKLYCFYLNQSYWCLEVSVVCSGVKESDDEDEEEEENNTSPVKRPSNMTLAKVPQVISHLKALNR